MKYIATVGEQTFEVEINSEDELLLNGRRLMVDFESSSGQHVYSLLLDGKSYEAYVTPSDTSMQVLLQGQLFQVDVEDERQLRLRRASGAQVVASGEIQLRAPMPGLIVAVLAEEAQQVAKGDNLVILESMKMQNELKAPRDGAVSRIRVKPGDSVEQNQALLNIL
jgi:biotin carboxyl carrier protein